MSYTNSPLVDCKVMSPNHSGTRTHNINAIIPHCVVGQLVAENIGYCFDDPSTQSSCNYGIGTEGRVCLIVDEANRSWCTSSRWIDQRGITIECASDKKEPYAMNDKVYNKLIDLCVDICKRNGKKKLLWFADKDKTIDYLENKIAKDEMVFAVHRWFENKSCPGNWLYSRLGDVAAEVTKRLGGTTSAPTSSTTATGKYYRVRKSWADAASQLGAYTNLENAKKACKDGYTVYDWNGVAVYPVKAEPTVNNKYTQEQFVRDIQSVTGSKVDGFPGPETIGNTITISAKINSKHPAVKFVQKRFNALGFDCGVEDCHAGPKFTNAVNRYQREVLGYKNPDGEITARNKMWKSLLGMN